MPLSTDKQLVDLSKRVVDAFDKVDGGVHRGFRPAHAKGLLLAGVFQPSAEAKALTRAPHIQRDSVPVNVRFSDFAGVPTIPDNHEQAAPRGCAIRFHLGEHTHTDIVAHSIDAFPARTAEEFLGFLNALIATDAAGPHPNAIEQFLGSHPAALSFVQAPKPTPVSFAKESFFAVSAFQFINASGATVYGRYRILPAAGDEYLDAAKAAQQSPNFLFDELKTRIAAGPIAFRIQVQLAEAGDVVDNATVRWPETRKLVNFGEVRLNEIVANNDAEQQQIIFDPIPRVDGIEASADPLFEPRANVYLMCGRRRRASGTDVSAFLY